MRNRQLIAKWAFEQGKADNVIERVERGGKTYVVVQDYVRLRKLFGELLREIQRIKSEGDFESARDLVETYGVQLETELHKQIRDRYAALKVAPYAGFIQPELVPVKKAGVPYREPEYRQPEEPAAPCYVEGPMAWENCTGMNCTKRCGA